MLRAYGLTALNWIAAILLRYGSGSLPSKNMRRRAHNLSEDTDDDIRLYFDATLILIVAERSFP
jgi:hypothetical protein